MCPLEHSRYSIIHVCLCYVISVCSMIYGNEWVRDLVGVRIYDSILREVLMSKIRKCGRGEVTASYLLPSKERQKEKERRKKELRGRMDDKGHSLAGSVVAPRGELRGGTCPPCSHQDRFCNSS